MLSKVSNLIYEHLSVLIGKRMRYIGRAGNLTWLGFGRDTTSRDVHGLEKTFAQFVLHIQCSFRICMSGKKLLGSYDLYEPNSQMAMCSDFNWETHGLSLYDEHAQTIRNMLSQKVYKVLEIACNDFCDLTIILSDKMRIEIFSNNSSEAEDWRFFEHGREVPHFIVTGQGIEEN